MCGSVVCPEVIPTLRLLAVFLMLQNFVAPDTILAASKFIIEHKSGHN